MTVLPIWTYAGSFALGLSLSLGLTPLALRLALRLRVLDCPTGYKTQEAPVPCLGGVAIAVSFSVVVALAAALAPVQGALRELVTILIVGVALSLLGLADDWGHGLSPWLRLTFQGAAGITMVAAGVTVGLFSSPVLNAVVTVVWVVGITNAFNLLDNMDGLSAGVAAIAAGFFFLIAAMNGQYLVASLAVALAGCTLGFLRSNFHPARIYMGDAGSLFIGFLLAVLGLKLAFEAPGQATFLVPVLVLGVSIFDTSLVTAARILHGRNPFRGGRDHTSHRLVFVGIPVPVTVSLIYAAAVALGWLSFVMARLDIVTGVLLLGLVIAIGLLLGLILGSLPVYEPDRRLTFTDVVARPTSEQNNGDVDFRRRAGTPDNPPSVDASSSTAAPDQISPGYEP